MSKQKKQNNSSFSVGGVAGETVTAAKAFSKIIPISRGGEGPLLYEGKNLLLHEHFNYEVNMFRFAGEKMNTLVEQRDKFRQEKNELKEGEYNIAINMALEVFVVHWRALIEFLYSERKNWPDDIRAWDFTDRDKWRETRGNMSRYFRDLKLRAGKEVAHLTSSRKYEDDPEKIWPYEEMKTELEKIIKLFIRAI